MKNIPTPESSAIDWNAISPAFRNTAARIASFNANPMGYIRKNDPNTIYSAPIPPEELQSMFGDNRFVRVFSEHQVRGMETALIDAVHRVDSSQNRVSNLLKLLEAEMWQTRELRAEIARLRTIQHSTPVKPFRRIFFAADS